ncbi:MAG: SpoIIE family protein phosphatase [Acidobacteriota bacterium]
MTAALMGLISQQLYENTPAEKYATFFCSTYDEETGKLLYTNAGHSRPIWCGTGSPARSMATKSVDEWAHDPDARDERAA